MGSLPGIVFFGKMCIKQVLKNRIILKQFSEAVNTKKALNLSIFPFLHHPQDNLYLDDSFADVHALKPKSSFVPWAMFLNACFLEDLVVPSHPNNSIVSISFHCNRHLSTSFVTFSDPCPLALSLINKSIHCQRHLIRSHFPVIIPS